ncbi:MAG: TRAP transporter large permease subunit [Rhodospirillales bacterium]|nr:TRAP transporter large permease subunit [Rhodospirillales bacterium]
MADAETLKREIAVCMFGQYGMIADMQGGLREVAAEYLKGTGWTGGANAFVTWWRRAHFENSMIDALLHRAHMSYRAIGELSVRHALTRGGLRIPRTRCAGAVKSRYKIVMLSNGDPDMLEGARPHHGIAFHAMISVAEANAFKPHRATCESAARGMGVGLFAPPFGLGYDAACTIGRLHPDKGLRAIWPYLGALIVGLLLVAAVPWFSTGLPR